MPRLTDEQVKRWAELCEAATPGPLGVEPGAAGDVEVAPLDDRGLCDWDREIAMFIVPNARANAKFYCVAIVALPALLAERAELLAEIARLRERIDRVLAIAGRGVKGQG